MATPGEFGHHHDEENREGDATANESPLVGTNPVGGCFGELWWSAKHLLKPPMPCIEEGFFIGHHQLDKDAIIVRYFHVQHAGLPTNDAIEPLNGNVVSLNDGRGLYADEFVMFHIGRVAEGTEDG